MNLVEASGISLSLGGQPILHGISLQLQAGEMLGLIGPNGAGKSSLLKIIAGIVKPAAGSLLIDGCPLNRLKDQTRARSIAYLAQSGTAHWPISVARIVALGRLPYLGSWRSASLEDRRIIEQALQRTGLLALAERPFPTLSGGEKARVLLARALAVEPKILLADEPVAALDLSHQLEVMDLLRQHCNDGGTALVVLHDLRLAAHYCDRLLLLYQGRTLDSGIPESVISDNNLQRAYGIRIRRKGGSLMDAFALTWSKTGDQAGSCGSD
ncbi:MAG: ABC transporter ATP-binding protein [Gammaproteobacteria bacterium]|nr:ABC transporter ATP-binding protein [Gammaproteobacteria bacterium]